MKRAFSLKVSTELTVFLLVTALFQVSTLVRGNPALHNLQVSLTGPAVKSAFNHLPSGNSTILNATVVNTGDSYEPNVGLQLLINGTMVLSASAAGLAVNQTFWTAYYWSPEDGVYNLTVYSPPVSGEDNVADNNGTKWIWVSPSQPPVVDFVYSPPPPPPGPICFETVTFDASSSYDPDWGGIVSYTWSFGDGNVTTVGYPQVAHTYATWGTVTVSLSVLDTENLVGNDSMSITIHARPSVRISVEKPSPPYYVNQNLTFSASRSFDPDNDTGPTRGIANYTWNFGDDSEVLTTFVPAVNHSYAQEGAYNVTLRVVDYDDGLTSEGSNPVSVFVGRPVAAFTPPTECYVYHPLTFDSSASYDPDNDTGPTRGIANYAWDFGDGNKTTVSEPLVTHEYRAPGTYNVNLTVTDYDEGLRAYAVRAVSVSFLLKPGRCKDVIGQGCIQIIPVVVQNIFAERKNFTVKAYYDGLQPVNQTAVTLNPMESGEVTIQWTEIATWPKGVYSDIVVTLELYADGVLLANTTFQSPFSLTILGDVTGDFMVTMGDVNAVLDCFGTYAGHPRWDPNGPDADVNCDRRVTMTDLVAVLDQFGEQDP